MVKFKYFIILIYLMEIKELNLDGITGILYKPEYKKYSLPISVPRIGVVFEVGIIGDCSGMEKFAENIAYQTACPIIIKEGSNHGRNRQGKFSLGNNAKGQSVFSEYLKNNSIDIVVGAGISSGAVSAILAQLGYFHNIEKEVIAATTDEKRAQLLLEKLSKSEYKKPFDALILASLPQNFRGVLDPRMINPACMYALNKLTELKTLSEGEPLPKVRNRKYQLGALTSDDLDYIKYYFTNLLNPYEIMTKLSDYDEGKEINKRVTDPYKLFLIPALDAVNNGLNLVPYGKWKITRRDKTLKKLRETYEVCIGDNDIWGVLREATHWLNHPSVVVGRGPFSRIYQTFGQSYALRASEIQDLIIRYIKKLQLTL